MEFSPAIFLLVGVCPDFAYDADGDPFCEVFVQTHVQCTPEFVASVGNSAGTFSLSTLASVASSGIPVTKSMQEQASFQSRTTVENAWVAGFWDSLSLSLSHSAVASRGFGH